KFIRSKCITSSKSDSNISKTIKTINDISINQYAVLVNLFIVAKANIDRRRCWYCAIRPTEFLRMQKCQAESPDVSIGILSSKELVVLVKDVYPSLIDCSMSKHSFVKSHIFGNMKLEPILTISC